MKNENEHPRLVVFVLLIPFTWVLVFIDIEVLFSLIYGVTARTLNRQGDRNVRGPERSV